MSEDLAEHDPITKAAHYNAHPSGVECIEIIEHMTFNTGQIFKYLWRAGLKTTDGRAPETMALEDYQKALYYLDREIARLSRAVHVEFFSDVLCYQLGPTIEKSKVSAHFPEPIDRVFDLLWPEREDVTSFPDGALEKDLGRHAQARQALVAEISRLEAKP